MIVLYQILAFPLLTRALAKRVPVVPYAMLLRAVQEWLASSIGLRILGD